VSPRRTAIPSWLLVGAAIAVVGLACGEVPTLPDGVAYISPIILPSPAVAKGDTLRDSTGKVAPIVIFGVNNAGDTVRTLTPRYIVTTVPGPSVTVTAANLVIGDSVRAVQIVGRIGDRLQTPPAVLNVVWQPDSIAAATNVSSTFPALGTGETTSQVALGVTVTSGANLSSTNTTRATVPSIIVRYAVTRVFPASSSIPDTTLVLIDDASRFLLPTGRASVDTTEASGNASRQIRSIPFGFDSVEITASANNLKGIALKGSPIRFLVKTK
jgi:hypothetical protein